MLVNVTKIQMSIGIGSSKHPQELLGAVHFQCLWRPAASVPSMWSTELNASSTPIRAMWISWGQLISVKRGNTIDTYCHIYGEKTFPGLWQIGALWEWRMETSGLCRWFLADSISVQSSLVCRHKPPAWPSQLASRYSSPHNHSIVACRILQISYTHSAILSLFGVILHASFQTLPNDSSSLRPLNSVILQQSVPAGGNHDGVHDEAGSKWLGRLQKRRTTGKSPLDKTQPTLAQIVSTHAYIHYNHHNHHISFGLQACSNCLDNLWRCQHSGFYLMCKQGSMQPTTTGHTKGTDLLWPQKKHLFRITPLLQIALFIPRAWCRSDHGTCCNTDNLDQNRHENQKHLCMWSVGHTSNRDI